MKKISLLLLSFVLPTVTYAIDFTGNLVPCGDAGEPECTFCHLTILAMNILDYLVILTALLATILFINAGIFYLFSGGNPGKIARAHKIFTSAAIGFVVVLSAYLVIAVVMTSLYNASPLQVVGGDWNDIITCPAAQQHHKSLPQYRRL